MPVWVRVPPPAPSFLVGSIGVQNCRSRDGPTQILVENSDLCTVKRDLKPDVNSEVSSLPYHAA